MMLKIVFIIIVLSSTNVFKINSQFTDCHNDPLDDPEDGPDEMRFTWLATLQYIHIKNGTPHYFRVPRVVLISRQHVLSTAIDAAQVPKGYALGNIVFGEYDRDESECGNTEEQMKDDDDDEEKEEECGRAVLVVPLADVLLHPEYRHFGVSHSVALLRLLAPVRSEFMLPVCLPYQNYLFDADDRPIKKELFQIDFNSDAPRDPFDEEKEATKVYILPRQLCQYTDGLVGNVDEMRTETPDRTRVMCATGCGSHSGAPLMMHEKNGFWAIVALSQGGTPCPDPLIERTETSPQRYTVLRKYVTWFTAAITGRMSDEVDENDPFGYSMGRSRSQLNSFEHGFHGYWWLGGIHCYDRGQQAENHFRFYYETFIINPNMATTMQYYLELYTEAPAVICVKVSRDKRYKVEPKIWHLGQPEIKLRIPISPFWVQRVLHVEAWARNATIVSVDEPPDRDSS